MSQYFLRYTGNPQADLERGFSFQGYYLVATREAMLRDLAEMVGDSSNEEFDQEAWNEENDYRVAQDNITKMWGVRRAGLCGFGSFDSIEEAIEAMSDTDCQYHATSHAAIFEGTKVYDQELDGLDDGITFRPLSIVATFIFDSATRDYIPESN